MTAVCECHLLAVEVAQKLKQAAAWAVLVSASAPVPVTASVLAIGLELVSVLAAVAAALVVFDLLPARRVFSQTQPSASVHKHQYIQSNAKQHRLFKVHRPSQRASERDCSQCRLSFLSPLCSLSVCNSGSRMHSRHSLAVCARCDFGSRLLLLRLRCCLLRLLLCRDTPLFACIRPA